MPIYRWENWGLERKAYSPSSLSYYLAELELNVDSESECLYNPMKYDFPKFNPKL